MLAVIFLLVKRIICPWPNRERIQWTRRQSATHPYRRYQMEVCYTSRSGRFIPREERRYQLNRKMGGLYSLYGRLEDKENCSLQDSNNGPLSCSSI
jgi:hypothetical protein